MLDVGCGPGNSTELLAARYPQAEIVGVDSSPEMIAAARKRLPSADFAVADIDDYAPATPFDVIFGNAVFQWVPDHHCRARPAPRLCPPGGAIAIQVPDNRNEPTHMLMAAVARGGPWREKFVQPIRRDFHSAAGGILRPAEAARGLRRRLAHDLLPRARGAGGDRRVGQGHRPPSRLDRLDAAEREAYLAAYTERIAETYPPLVDGRVMLRFPRLFVVAVRA